MTERIKIQKSAKPLAEYTAASGRTFKSPFVPGNKFARPPYSSTKQLCTQAILAELLKVDKDNRSRIEKLGERLVQLALGYDWDEYVLDKNGRKVRITHHEKPDLQAIIAVCDRMDGKPKQQVEASIDTRSEIVVRTAEEIAQSLRDKGIPVDDIFASAKTITTDDYRDETIADGLEVE